MTEDRRLRQRTRRSFLMAGASGFAGAFGWRWIWRQPEEGALPKPLRSMHERNRGLWQRWFDRNRVPPLPARPQRGAEVRINGDIGLELASPPDWRLRLPDLSRELSLDVIRNLPKTETVTEFKCIEGWSEVFAYGGVRFSDFLSAMGVRDLPAHVGLETPDREYYVSIDMESMLHPQTLLAYEMNGESLTVEHGAPLRLVIPVKYGIKSLKRIGTIRFSGGRLPDYWAERGYDWYSGL